MKKHAVVKNTKETECSYKRRMDQYYSVEFSINGPNVPHQFKIWRIPPTAMCVLVKEDSHVLRGIKVGDTLKMKYYSAGSSYPTDYLDTAIRNIEKNDQKRFRNHYFVGLEILEAQDQKKAH